MINIFDLNQLSSIFPENQFNILACNDKFNLLTELNPTNHLNLTSPINKFFSNKTNFIKSNKFNYIQLNFETYFVPAISFIASTNSKNIKYYIVCDTENSSHFDGAPNENYEKKIIDFCSFHLSKISSCLNILKDEISNLNNGDLNTDLIDESINKITKFCYSNLKTYKNIDLYYNLVNNTRKVKLRPTNIDTSIRTFICNINDLANTKDGQNIHFDIKCRSSSHDVSADIDTELFSIVVTELIANSFKFSLNPPKIRVNITNDDKFIYVEFIDEGIGFPSSVNSKSFDPFVAFAQHHNIDISSDLAGLGLGLSICKNIISLFNGDISISPKTKIGAKVTITLPIFSNRIGYNFNSNVFNYSNSNFSYERLSFANIFDLDLSQ